MWFRVGLAMSRTINEISEAREEKIINFMFLIFSVKYDREGDDRRRA